MIRLWKNFRVNLMYWRFRHITRNRLRLQSWWNRRQKPTRAYRPRGTAAYVYHRSPRRAWVALLVLVSVLTAVTVVGRHIGLAETIIYIVNTLVIVGALYWAVRAL
jgi:hypothetical protein